MAVPFQFQAALLQEWVLPNFMCSFCPTIQVISLNISIFTLVAISCDRYRAVIYPLTAKSNKVRSKFVILFIWIASIALSVPTSLAFRVVYVKTDRDGMKPICEISWHDEEMWQIYSHTLVVVQYIIPFIIISFAYSHMGYRLSTEKNSGIVCRVNTTRVVENKKRVSRSSSSI